MFNIKKIITLSVLTTAFATTAFASTQYINYPVASYGASTGTVQFRNQGDAPANIYIDGYYLCTIQARDRVIVRNVITGRTDLRWEYLNGQQGGSRCFTLRSCQTYRYTFRPRTQSCGTGWNQPQQVYPTYPQYPTYPTRPNYGGGNFGLRISDDFFLGIGNGNFFLDID